MLLNEFRSLTEHLPGELEFLTAGAGTELLFHSKNCLSVDSERYVRDDLGADDTVLWVDKEFDEA